MLYFKEIPYNQCPDSYRESVIFYWGSVLYLQLHSFWELFAFVCFQLCYWFSDAVTLINCFNYVCFACSFLDEPGKQVRSAIRIKNTSKSHVAFKVHLKFFFLVFVVHSIVIRLDLAVNPAQGGLVCRVGSPGQPRLLFLKKKTKMMSF